MEEDCTHFRQVYKDMGGTDPVPENCCELTRRVQCNSATRIFGLTMDEMPGGTLSPALVNIPLLQMFNASNSNLVGQIPQNYTQKIFYTFDVYNNELVGELPEMKLRSDIPSFADFRRNKFVGGVPTSLRAVSVQAPRVLEQGGSCPYQPNMCVAHDQIVFFCDAPFTCTSASASPSPFNINNRSTRTDNGITSKGLHLCSRLSPTNVAGALYRHAASSGILGPFGHRIECLISSGALWLAQSERDRDSMSRARV